METITAQCRPKTIEEIIGMEHTKNVLYYDIEGSKNLNQPMPSYIVAGPAGTGKSTVAEIISIYSTRPDGSPSQVHKMLGSDITKADHLFDLAANCEDGDVIFIEEAHSIGGGGPKSKICQAILLEWIENFQILAGGDVFGLNDTQAPKVCFVLPTTNPGKLTHALRTRCKILHTSYYSIEEMEEILRRAGNKINLDLSSDEKALRLLAQSSRGTPRTAVMHRLDALRKVMSVDKLDYNIETVKRCLDLHHIHPWGLESNDFKYCTVLYNKIIETHGKPVGRKSLEQSLGLADDMIDMIEQYLLQIGVIRIESRGRMLTQFGYTMLGKDPIILGSAKADSIDVDKLLELLKDENIRKGGLRVLMPHFGLTYGIDNGIMQKALYEQGYIAKQKVGIVLVKKS